MLQRMGVFPAFSMSRSPRGGRLSHEAESHWTPRKTRLPPPFAIPSFVSEEQVESNEFTKKPLDDL
jgi:hypothetical protein